jgi:hypothetical protein
MLLRKAGGGSDSFGNEWKSDKHVVEVPDWQATELLAIADAGFTVVDAPEPEATPEPDPDNDPEPEPEPADEPVTEPTPEDETPVTEPAPPADNPADETPATPKPRARKATKAQPVKE